MFREIEGRDAAPTIRGYRYQVVQTLVRWVALGPEEHLILECGEDIDRVTLALKRRDLTQVKDLVCRVSLTTLKDSLANAVTHLLDHPEIDVRFEFITTAISTFERPRHFGSIVGIDAWRSIGEGTRPDLLPAMRALLVGLSRDRDFDLGRWTRFHEYCEASSDQELRKFIDRFQIQTSATNVENLLTELEEQLVTARDISREVVDSAIERLFFFVFKLLSQSGLKQLTTSTLATVLRTGLNTADQENLHSILSALSLVQGSLAKIDNKVGDVLNATDRIERRLEQLPAEIAGPTKIRPGSTVDSGQLQILRVDTEPPPQLRYEVDRIKAISEVSAALADGSIVAIVGKRGEGKTTLARQVYIAKPGLWMSFKNRQNIPELLAAERIALASRDTPTWERALSAVDGGTVIVLDDLPVFDPDVAEVAADISEACTRLGLALVITSRRPAHSRLSLSGWIEMSVPPMNPEEVLCLLKALGAPESSALPGFAAIVAAQCGGHPEVISLTCQAMHQRNWVVDLETVLGSIGQSVQSQISDETLSQLQAISEDAKELLFRLAVPFGEFDADLVPRLALVDSAVEQPGVRLNELLGDWVGRVQTKLTVNARARSLHSELKPAVKQICHRVVAESFPRELDPMQGLAKVAHLAQSDQPGIALYFAAQMIAELCRQPQQLIEHYGPYFLAIELKIEDEPQFLIMLAAQRVCLAAALGQDYANDLSTIGDLMPRMTGPAGMSGCLLAYFALANRDVEYPFLLGCELLLKGLPAVAALREVSDEVPDLGGGLEMSVVGLAAKMRTPTDAKQWVRLLDVGETDGYRLAFEESGGEFAKQAFDFFWLKEDNRLGVDQRSGDVLECCDILISAASRVGTEPLQALAVRIKAVVLGEYLAKHDEAIQVCDSFTSELDEFPILKELIEGVAIRQLVVGNRLEDAADRTLPFLQSASGFYPRERYLTALTVARAVAGDNLTLAAYCCDEAVRVAETSTVLLPQERFRCFAERSTIAFLQHGASTSWPWLDRAARVLETIDNESPFYRGRLVQFLHVAGYYRALAETGQPPESISNGEDYVAPFPGMFSSDLDLLVGMYTSNRRSVLPWTLSAIAEALDDGEREHYWIEIGLRQVKETQDMLALGSAAPRAIAFHLKNRADWDAFELALDAGSVLAVSSREHGAIFEEGYMNGVTFAKLTANDDQLAPYAESMAEHLFILQFAYSVAAHGQSDSDGASKRARAISERIGTRLDELKSPAWRAYASVLAEVSNRDGSASTMFAAASEVRDHPLVEAAARLLSFMLLDQSLPELLSLQGSIAGLTAKVYQPDRRSYETVVLEFLRLFWSKQLQDRRFLFSAPQLAEEGLAAALQLDPEGRFWAIVRALAPSLGVRLPDNQ